MEPLKNDRYQFVPFEFPSSPDGQYFLGLNEAGILRSRRVQLGLTQQDVADRAGIKLPQYQRLEAGTRLLSGCSMRIGLAICAVLLLDPYILVRINVSPPDPSTMKPQKTVEIHRSPGV